MYSHVPPRLLGAVLSIVICVAARAAMSFVMTANALRMVRLAGGAERGGGFEMSCVGLVLRHGRWPEATRVETLRARDDAGSSRAEVSGQRSGTGRDRSHAVVRRGRKTDPCVSDP